MKELNTINFRTKIPNVIFDFNVSYKSKNMFIGSCFTENIGKKLKQAKFEVDINPFGIVYNPISVKNSLQNLIENKNFIEEDIFYFNERWNSYSHHGKFAFPNKEETLININARVKQSSINLQNTDYLFITFGTAWVYELAKTKQVVSNCHKVPAKEFKKRILTVSEIVKIYSQLLQKLEEFNPKIKLIFTISPVRHLKDGFSENNLSKSTLKLAINEIVNTNTNCFYFPAYEIMLDDLRDYRFYNSDLLHPNETAINYIFNYFAKSFFNEETTIICSEINKIISAKQHRPFNLKSDNYLKFKQKFIKKTEELIKQYSFLNLEDELSFFNK